MSIHRSPMIMIVAFSITLGCTSKQKGMEAKEVVPASAKRVVSAEALSRLEAADKVDGKEDHVISKCYVCGLGMSGSEKFAVKLQDYTVHLCSKGCQHEFEESAEEIVRRTDIPK